MIEAPNLSHELQIKLQNAEMSLGYGQEFILEARSEGYRGWDKIAPLVGTNSWNLGLAKCIRGLKADLGIK